MRNVRSLSICASLVAGAFFAAGANAAPIFLNSDLSIYMGDLGFPNSAAYPSVVNEKDIFLQSATSVTLGHGNIGTNNTGQPIADFQASTTVDFSNGNANIKPINKPTAAWTSLTVSVPATSTYTGAFGDLFFGVKLDGGTGNDKPPLDLTITAYNGVNPLGSLTLTDSSNPGVKANADEGFLVLALGSNVITSVVIGSTSGFSEIKQFDISDLQLVCTENCGGGGSGIAAPLPAALPLFVSGLGALGFVGWRRKRKAAKAA